MSICWSSGSNGADPARFCWSRMTKQGAPLVIYAQGSHSTADTIYASGRAPLERLADSGFIVAVADLSQTTTQGTFGNSTAQARIETLRAYLAGSASFRASTGKARLVSGSGGFAAAINYARANPALVESVAGVAPLVDLQDLYENRLPQGGVTQAEVDAAYGGSVAANYATHNPSAAGNQAALAGIPIKLWYSTNDPFIPAERVLNFKSLVEGAGGTCAVESLGAVGHSDTGLNYADVAAFL